MEDRLPSEYFIFTPKNGDSKKEVSIEEAEKIKRREKLIQFINNRFNQQSLRDRLDNLKVTEISVGDILNEGLFKFLPDEILLTDLYPQSNEPRSTNKIKNDPLWVNMAKHLTTSQQAVVLATLKTLESFSKKLEDQGQKELAKRMLKYDHLITLGDARQVPLIGWESLAGFGKTRANIIYTAVKK